MVVELRDKHDRLKNGYIDDIEEENEKMLKVTNDDMYNGVMI